MRGSGDDGEVLTSTSVDLLNDRLGPSRNQSDVSSDTPSPEIRVIPNLGPWDCSPHSGVNLGYEMLLSRTGLQPMGGFASTLEIDLDGRPVLCCGVPMGYSDSKDPHFSAMWAPARGINFTFPCVWEVALFPFYTHIHFPSLLHS